MSEEIRSIGNIYLVGAQLDKSGDIVTGTVKPIANTFIALKDDGTKVTQQVELNAAGEPIVVNSVAAGIQLYLTGDAGLIQNFESGKVNNTNVESVEPFTLGKELSVFSEKTKLYFPPQQLIMYNMVMHGYENWIDEIRKNINTISGLNGSGIDLADQSVLKTVSVNERLLSNKGAKNKTSNNSKNDIEELIKIKAIVLPQTKAISVVFSNQAYSGAIVTIFNRHGKKVFSNDPFSASKNSRKALVEPINQADVGMFAATFYDPAGEYQDAASSEDKVYRIEVTLDQQKSKSLKLNNLTYNLVERIRFPITNLAGEFEFINGDAISLEEAMIKQFPGVYSHLIEKINASDNPITASQDIQKENPGFSSYLHGWQNNLNKMQTASGILGAEHGFLGAKAFGALLVDNLDVFKQTKIGNISIKDVANIAFSVYDSGDTISKLIKDIRRLESTGLGILSNVADIRGISRALKDSSALRAVGGIADRLADAHNAIDLNHVVNLSERYKDILKSTNGFFNKAGDLAGKPMDALSLASAVHGAFKATESLSSSQVRYKGIMIEYAKRVHMADLTAVKESEQEALKKDIEAFQGKHHIVEKKRNGQIHYLNITFNFDRSQFKPDDSFSDFIELFSSFPKDSELTLIGHTCDMGTDEYNLGLSLRRANAVKEALKLSDDDSARVLVEGRGESEPVYDNNKGESERLKNRRVVAQLSLHQNKNYYPSREGLDVLERARSVYTINYLKEGDAIKKAAIAAIDLVMGAPKVHPLHAAAALLWYVGGVIMDIGEFSDKLIFGEDFINDIKKQNQQGMLSVANQALIMSDQDSSDGRNGDDVLSEQFRLRVEALTGLQRLLMRCAIENGDWLDGLRSGNDFINYADTRTKFDFNSNVEYYRVQEYVECYLLNDGWELDMGPIFPVALDEQWIQLLETGKLDEPPLKIDAAWYETAARKLKEQIPRSLAFSDILSPVFLISEEAKKLKKQALNGLMSSPLIGANYIWNNINNYNSGHRDDTTKAKFQSYMPIHYTASKKFSDLALTLKPKFTSLDKSIYLCMNIRSRKLGSKGESGWAEVNDKTELTPFDQVRISIILDSKNNDAIKNMISSQDTAIQYLPIQVYPVRLDGWNMEGPHTKTYARKLSESELTTEDKVILTKAGISFDEAYGAVIIPFYMLGANQIFGTKPMSGSINSWLNISGDEIEGFWNADNTWEMDYGYEVVVANQANTKKLIEFDGGLDEFTLTLNGQRVHKLTNPKGFSSEVSEKCLIDKEFLAIGQERAEYPALFKGAKSYCFMRSRGVEGGKYFYPSKTWDENMTLKKDRYGVPQKGVADVSEFRWDRPVELAVLVVCDKIETEAYENRNYNWKSIPANIQLHRATSMVTWIDGPAYNTSLKYIGKIEESNNDVKLVWDEKSKLPAKHKSIQRLLTRNPDKQNIDKESLRRLKMLSGLDADDNKLEELIESWLPNSAKYVYAATIKLDYQTATGLIHSGLKPFSSITNPSVMAKNKGWNLAVKLSTKGNSGFNDDDVNGQFTLPYPSGFQDENAHWYAPLDKRTAFKSGSRNADEIIRINKEIVANNASYSDTEAYDPIEPLSPLVPWRIMDKENADFWSDKRKDFVESWLLDQNTQRYLPMADTAVLASKKEFVDEANDA